MPDLPNVGQILVIHNQLARKEAPKSVINLASMTIFDSDLAPIEQYE